MTDTQNTPVMKASTFGSESGHWYTSDGLLVEAVPKKSGGTMRPTLRHARELQLAPGVTSILKEAASPGLQNWLVTQHVLAALTLDREPGETDESYLSRVREDAATHGQEAAACGTKIHGAIERAYCGQSFDPEFEPHVSGVRRLLDDVCGDQRWLPEHPCVSKLGYATKSDLHSEEWVIDFKGTDKDLSPDCKRPLGTFDSHHMQLAATRAALEPQIKSHPRCAIVYVSRNVPGMCRFVEVKEETLVQGLEMFTALLRYWQAARNYRPDGVEGAF